MTLRIEPFAPYHAPAVQCLASDPRIAAMTLLPEPYPEDGAFTFIRLAMQARAAGEAYSFAVLAGDELIGSCGLKEVHDGQADLGYWIGVPFWGRGYASEAARLIVAFGFDELGLDRVTAHALERNPGSWRVLEKVGFTLLERVANPFAKWTPEDIIRRYALDRADWIVSR
ncbi:MAG: GNAT family N-acetyltransferase [Rhodothermaceae bacterium]|nr:GNAT family N-acetyltransferase [Rhodothermaceae bacterium]